MIDIQVIVSPANLTLDVNRDCTKVLRGHTSTVRCLKMSDSKTAISGSRDTTLRIWDIEKGICLNILVGHSASVRCLEIHGDLVVSGSYDTTARVGILYTTHGLERSTS